MSNKIPDEKWSLLTNVMPDANEISQKDRTDLYGLVRRTIIKENEQKSDAINIFTLEDIESLKLLIQSLPYATDEEVNERILELRLSPEESELEVSHWAFNYQSVKGELLIDNELINFQLVRLYEHTYLLLCQEERPEITDAFSRAFGKDSGAYSKKALQVENDHWYSWAWFTDSDPLKNRDASKQFNEIWKDMDKNQ